MSARERTYEQELGDARATYRALRPAFSPVLESMVGFSRMGFDHLMYKKRVARTKDEQLERFLLIPLIARVLSDERADIAYRQKAGRHHGRAVLIRFWGFTQRINRRDITVVVTQIGDRQPQFLSVFAKKQRPR